MKKLALIKSSINKVSGRSGLLLKKHSPEILIGVGVVGVVASTIMACKATLKIDELINNSQEKIGKIKEAKEKFPVEEYSDQDYKKDLTIVYVQRGVDLIKLYGPSVLLGVASISCIIGAHGIMKRRNLALVAAYKAIEESFSTYRKRVVEELGDEKDKEFKTGIRKETVTVTEVDEKGKKVKTKKSFETADPSEISQYARFFDETSVQWSNIPEYNLTFLKCQQNYANDLLKSRGHIFLNEVYDMLGLPRSQAGAVVGWVKGVGDDFVDFGMFDVNVAGYRNERVNDTVGEERRDFVNGYKNAILLDFNVDGVIYDLI